MNNQVFLENEELQKKLSLLPRQTQFSEMLKSAVDGAVKILLVVTSPESSPKAESHDNFNDLFIVQAGKEEFWVGGEITDKKEIEKGEWMGESLVGAQKIVLQVGDVLVVPKGVPHKHGIGSATIVVIKTS